MARKKHETVSLSFHYLVREVEGNNGEPQNIPLTVDDFERFCESIKNLPKVNLDDEPTLDKLRAKQLCSIESLEILDERTSFGVFKAPYSGHAYENSEKGKISADSVSLRSFHFLMYLSESGRIYLGCQYLGLYGGYTPLILTLKSCVPHYHEIRSRSMFRNQTLTKDFEIVEIQAEYSRKSKSIAEANSFGQRGVLLIRKKDYPDFHEKIATRLMPSIDKSESEITKRVASLLSESEIISMEDDDIENCTIWIKADGKKKPLRLLEFSGHATKFPINVPINKDGHPVYEPTKRESLRILTEEIIRVSENV